MADLPDKLASAIEAAPDPRAAETWFQQLPEERRREWTEEWRSVLRRKAELGLRERRLAWVDGARTAALFALADRCTTHGDVVSLLLTAFVGLALGGLLAWWDRGCLATILLLLPAWLAVQSATLGGLGVMHFFVGFPLGCAIGWVGLRREERVFD